MHILGRNSTADYDAVFDFIVGVWSGEGTYIVNARLEIDLIVPG